MAPDVSVIIPLYGRIGLAQQAVRSCLTSADDLRCEVIVVDDCSPEDFSDVVWPIEVRYVRLPENGGRGRARNFGLDLARAEFVKFLDSDDLLAPGSLAAEVRMARVQNADIVVSGWRVVTVCAMHEVIVQKCFEPPRFSSHIDDVLAGKGVFTSAALYRRNLAFATRWAERNLRHDDWDFFARALLGARIVARHEGIAYDWCHHGEQVSYFTTDEEYVSSFYDVLLGLISRIDDAGLLTPARQKRGAQYLWKELRRCFVVAPQRALAVLAEIRRLDPHFRPRDEESSQIWRAIGGSVMLLPALHLYRAFRILSRKARSRF